MKKGLLILILILGTTASILGQTPTETDVETLRRRVMLLQIEPQIERSSKPAIDEDIVRRLEKEIFFAEWRRQSCPVCQEPLDLQGCNPLLWICAMCRKWFDGDLKRK